MEGHEGGHDEGQKAFDEEGQRHLLRKDVVRFMGTVGIYFMRIETKGIMRKVMGEVMRKIIKYFMGNIMRKIVGIVMRMIMRKIVRDGRGTFAREITNKVMSKSM